MTLKKKKKRCLVASCNPKRIVKYWENICNFGPLDAFFLVDSRKKKYKRNIIKITIFCFWSNLNTIRLRHYLLFSPCKCACLANFILHYKFISIFSIKSTFSISHNHSCVYLIGYAVRDLECQFTQFYTSWHRWFLVLNM